MASERHQRAKALFLEARELPKSEQAAFVRSKSADDAELMKEVLDLLEHDREETLLSIDQKTTNTPRVDPLGLNKLNKHTRSYTWQKVLFSSRGRAGIALMVLALIIAALGYLAATNIKSQLAVIRAEETLAILKSNVQALRFWIDDYKTSTRLAIADHEVRNAIADLANNINIKPAHQCIDSIMQMYMQQTEADYFIITDLAGFILHAQDSAAIRSRINAKYGETIYRASDGEEVFVLPFYPKMPLDSTKTSQRPYVWMQIPVRDHTGNIIATFGIGRYADTDFTRILRTARIGKSGETYAIDTDGNFISESRFEPLMRKMGILDVDTIQSSILNLQARTYNKTISSSVPVLTPLAVRIVSAQEANAGFAMGAVTEPSMDYKGHRVIGAWAWLPELNFGVITQLDADEAFAPLTYLYVLITMAVLLLLAASSISFYNAAQLVEVRGQLGSAIKMGQYQVEKIIAEGGMGTVYLASHQFLKRKTAIKVIRIDKNQEELARRFEREAKLASQLSHPNTIEIFDYGLTEDQQAFFAMEYLSGFHLGEIVSSEGPMPPERVIHVVQQVCGSLLEAHTRGLVHRDIKPQNIMLINKVGLPDFVKVLDFGLAKPLEQTANGDETRLITGTPVYLAPERLTRPGLAQPKADIYALGAVAYYLLAGRAIFSFSSDLDILYQVLNNEPEPLPETVPEEIRKLVAFCLNKDPANRPGDIRELKAFVDQLAAKYPWPVAAAENWWKKHAV
jgi:tRNA A-37 threonylcarbamoyl transferase component Bud32